jgi:hypothetical protein
MSIEKIPLLTPLKMRKTVALLREGSLIIDDQEEDSDLDLFTDN